MKTAIIVVGVVRELSNASSSWKILGDYYLFADEYERAPQSQIIKNKIILTDILAISKVKFQHISISKSEARSDWQGLTPVFNHFKKLLLAYKHIKNLGYEKFIIIRPDLFLEEQANDIVNNINVLPNNLAIEGVINLGEKRTKFKPSIDKDLLMCMDADTFEIIADFYNYLEINIKFLLENEFDVHTALAKYVIEQDLNIVNLYCRTVVLRDNSNYLFTSGTATFEKLQEAFHEWWKLNVDAGPLIHEKIKISKTGGGILKLRNISK